ncbi:MAG: hypothetical protein LBP27_06515, partial [Treponema sp.]|nr:hypothetical protein [Treponema sp.]
SGLLSATISFTTHCSAKLNDVALPRPWEILTFMKNYTRILKSREAVKERYPGLDKNRIRGQLWRNYSRPL